ncbi:hypothetical protein PC129_g11434 [Phytophthora cactorum]|uniref:Uncharacterized protein n=1 Tax=Phytophthora cactorum TaxID=29920 RepID=A0A329SHM3_9STRA|nr:hypothetical protein Pcac1_g12297 [Phytophthora cactorum]KAG2802476.1 hypothetical protein PC111_g19093 [Phytophthora cactorum]KAG2838382.1 hypothetical protein PC113_g19678 [Phytophthora cactorum]KAG2881441.1 hypothetical protein PC114_g21560 [Phytophthora cactorum]KAG2902656.1 hypothetical protein PC117_g21434 [Phytophthora cactorum]
MDYYGDDLGSDAGSDRYGDDRGGRSGTVQTEVERLEEAGRQRALRHRGAGEGETTEGQGQLVVGTEGRAEESEVVQELLAAGENEFKDAVEDPVPADPTASVAADKSEVKIEPNVKEEHDGGTDAFAGYGDEPSGYGGVGQRQSQMGEYGYGTSHAYFGADEEEEVKITPQRGPSSFIPRYTGPEARRTDRPAFGWSWSATKGSSATGVYGIPTSGYGPGPSI